MSDRVNGDSRIKFTRRRGALEVWEEMTSDMIALSSAGNE